MALVLLPIAAVLVACCVCRLLMAVPCVAVVVCSVLMAPLFVAIPAALVAMALVLLPIRITSYNVCYTKLLRNALPETNRHGQIVAVDRYRE